MRKALYWAVFFSLLPMTTSAQSLEWMAEHPGQVTPAVVVASDTPIVAPSTIISATTKTNDGLEQNVRAHFANNPIMSEIARCESRFRQFDDSGMPLDGGAGSMIGIFQINAPVHANFAKGMGMDIYTVDGNLAYAKYLYQHEGTNPWLSSFDCWHNASQTNASLNTQELTLGAISSEVKALQVMLNAKGYVLATDGPGSPGQETEKFGLLTRTAVRKFQCAVMRLCSGDEHSTGYGLVGVKTREALMGVAATAASVQNTNEAVEIERLQKLIAELSAQLFALKQKLGSL
jgi:hypothetical protein